LAATFQGLPVAEELVVLVVAAEAPADVGEVGDELDPADPLDLLEAQLDLDRSPAVPCYPGRERVGSRHRLESWR